MADTYTNTYVLVPDGFAAEKAELSIKKATDGGETPDWAAIAKACGGEVGTHEIPVGSTGPIVVVGVKAPARYGGAS